MNEKITHSISNQDYMSYINNIAKILNEYGIKTSRDKITASDNPGDHYDVYEIVDDTMIFIDNMYLPDNTGTLRFYRNEVVLYGCNNLALKAIKRRINK